MEKIIEKAKRQRNTILSQDGKSVTIDKDYYQGMEKDRYELILSEKEKIEHRITQDDIMRQRIVEWGTRLQNKLGFLKIEGE